MKRKDGALNPARKLALPAPKLVCGAALPGGGNCDRAVPAAHPCWEHGGPRPAQETGLPEGFRIHKAFVQEDRQLELEKYVGRILVEYALNEAADLRQVLLSGIAYVRLLFDGATMEPKELEMLSRVVDRHLRNLRATPKEQSAGKTGSGIDGPQLPPGMVPAAILERVRLALTPGQVASLMQGRQPAIGPGRLSDAGGSSTESGELEVQPAEAELFPTPRRAAADPFAVLDAEDDDGSTAPLPAEIDPFGD